MAQVVNFLGLHERRLGFVEQLSDRQRLQAVRPLAVASPAAKFRLAISFGSEQLSEWPSHVSSAPKWPN